MCMGMQCLMCTSDHIALASELWCTMLRNGEYVRSVDGDQSHLCDFRANLCQAEAHTWKDYSAISRRIRGVKLDTEECLTAEDIIKVEANSQVFNKLRSIWEEVMQYREAEKE